MTIQDVQSLYERRPYPHYPLFAKPRWQDGYLGSSLFAQLLAGETPGTQTQRHVLSIGCGEILPYIMRQWEPPSSELVCVDLSRRSLNRAAIRCLFSRGKTRFIQADINQLLQSKEYQTKLFDHIEAYGVIHHIDALDRTVQLMKEHLAPSGTLRIMVYNARARDWIWHLNRIFGMLGFSYDRDDQIHRARKLLYEWAKHSPRLTQHLQGMGYKSLQNNTRFADTFLHPREARLDLARWLTLFAKNQLKPFALYDRYGELDDLPNPLWQMPTIEQLTKRAEDFRFENNLEIWLKHETSTPVPTKIIPTKGVPLSLRLKQPPSQWQRFPETKRLGMVNSLNLWHGWLRTVFGFEVDSAISAIKKLPLHEAQRLARIGAILPAQARAAGRYQELLAPMTQRVDAPMLPESQMLTGIDQILERLPKDLTEKKRRQISRRLKLL